MRQPRKDLTPFQKDILGKIREHIARVFLKWENAAKEARDKNNPLNDQCIDEMEKEILPILGEEYRALGAMQLVYDIQEDAAKIFAEWKNGAQKARDDNQAFNDLVIEYMKREIDILIAD